MNIRGIMILALLPLLIIGCGQSLTPQTGKVTSLDGEATMVVNGQSKPVEVGMEVPQGATIRTGDSAQVDVRLKDDVAISLESSGEVTVDQLAQNPKTKDYQISLKLQRGQLLNRADALSRGSSYQVATPTTVCGIRGTRFSVKTTGDETEVGVLEGKVTCNLHGTEVTLSQDQIATFYKDKPATDVRQMVDRERERLARCNLVNLAEGIKASRSIVNISNTGTIQKDIEAFAMANGRYPDTLEEVYGGKPQTDQWGRAYVYKKTGDSNYTLASMGEDAIPGTTDDIVIK